MKPMLLLTLAAIYIFIGGLSHLFAPDLNYYLEASTSAYSLNIIRATGGLFIGLAIVLWFARNAEASKARDAIFLGNAIGFFINVIFVVVAVITPDGVAMTWGIAVINLLFAICFFVVGRANMSTNPSLVSKLFQLIQQEANHVRNK
jgi:succinate-acetate transporter protein